MLSRASSKGSVVAVVLALPGVAVLAQGPAEAPLEAPGEVQICQVDYGRQGVVAISWSNRESYDTVEFSLDDQLAPGVVDGTFGLGRVLASPGRHLFGVRGLLGERRSPWATAEFTLLAESPVPLPITNLKCQQVPGGGARLRLVWEQGPDAWVAGRLEVPGQAGGVDIPAGATTAEIALAPPSDGQPANNSSRVARVAFKNADNYFSEPLTPLCPLAEPELRRGDCNGSGAVNITDPIVLLNHLFLGGKRWTCDDACDLNDDGKVDISDPVSALSYLFQGSEPPPSPGPARCGSDPTEDFLGGSCVCGV